MKKKKEKKKNKKKKENKTNSEMPQNQISLRRTNNRNYAAKVGIRYGGNDGHTWSRYTTFISLFQLLRSLTLFLAELLEEEIVTLECASAQS